VVGPLLKGKGWDLKPLGKPKKKRHVCGRGKRNLSGTWGISHIHKGKEGRKEYIHLRKHQVLMNKPESNARYLGRLERQREKILTLEGSTTPGKLGKVAYFHR